MWHFHHFASPTSVSPNNLSLSMFAMKYKHRKVAILTLKELTRAMHAMAEQLPCWTVWIGLRVNHGMDVMALSFAQTARFVTSNHLVLEPSCLVYPFCLCATFSTRLPYAIFLFRFMQKDLLVLQGVLLLLQCLLVQMLLYLLKENIKLPTWPMFMISTSQILQVNTR